MDKRTALIMIDMQRAYLEPESPVCIPGAKETVPACAELVRACRERGIPVVFVARCYRDDGSDVEHPRLESWLKAGRPVSVSAQAMPATVSLWVRILMTRHLSMISMPLEITERSSASVIYFEVKGPQEVARVRGSWSVL